MQKSNPQLSAQNYASVVHKEANLLLTEHQNCYFSYFPVGYFAVENPKKQMSAYDYAVEHPDVKYVQNGGYYHKSGVATGGVISNFQVSSMLSFDKGKIGKSLSQWHSCIFSVSDADGNISIHMTDSRNLFSHRKYVKHDGINYLYLDSDFLKTPKQWERDAKIKKEPNCKYLVAELMEAGKALVYDGEIIKQTFSSNEINKRRRSGIGIAKDKDGVEVIVSITSKNEMNLQDFAKFAKTWVEKDGYKLIDFMALDGGGSTQMVCDGKLNVVSSDVPNKIREAIESGDIDKLNPQNLLDFERYNRKVDSFIIFSDRALPSNPFEAK